MFPLSARDGRLLVQGHELSDRIERDQTMIRPTSLCSERSGPDLVREIEPRPICCGGLVSGYHSVVLSARGGPLSIVSTFHNISPAAYNIPPAYPHNGGPICMAYVDVFNRGAAAVAARRDVFDAATIHDIVDGLKFN